MANTTNYALTKPTVGGDADVWGGYLNTNWDDADALFSAIATTGSANAYVLTTGLSLAAYATGQKFTIIPNFTNSGAATINVDAIGAKNIYKNSAGTKGAVASGDIVSGVPIDIVYDGTQFVTNLSHAAQPLDATLTALAALSWSSGNPVVQFTAADTVSLTLTPSVTSLTLSGALTAGTNSLISGSAGAHGAATLAVVAGNGGASDYVFGVYGDSPENSANGDFLVTRAGDVGIGATPTVKLTVTESASEASAALNNTNASFATGMTYMNATRSGNSAYSFLFTTSNSLADTEHNLRGDGEAYCDGAWNGGGADYAEYFEWEDGNAGGADRRGISVVLVGNKVRPALEGDDPIGVVSSNPTVIGDSGWNRWSGKYLRDDYGAYILDESGDRTPNPEFDPSQPYVSREDRPEWETIGLMGKLRIRKGQPVGQRWIKMRDISETIEEWLVR